MVNFQLMKMLPHYSVKNRLLQLVVALFVSYFISFSYDNHLDSLPVLPEWACDSTVEKSEWINILLREFWPTLRNGKFVT